MLGALEGGREEVEERGEAAERGEVAERVEVAERGEVEQFLPAYLRSLCFYIFHVYCSFAEYVLASLAGALLWFAGAVDYSAPEAFQGPKQKKKWMVKR